MPMTWFEERTGITEEAPEAVYRHLSVEGGVLRSELTGWSAAIGRLETLSLAELRSQVPLTDEGRATVEEVVADVQRLHMRPENEGALFQVASQFNLLEMIGPSVTPEMGVARYEHDLTQGPACALACLAGTIYRNYFVPMGDQVGQTAGRQINCLEGVEALLGEKQSFLWDLRNGYALPTAESLTGIASQIENLDHDTLRTALRIGVQTGTEVTTNDAGRCVTQAYCSAMPVAYAGIDPELWEPLAQIILEAAYEATFLAALRNRAETGNNRVFLTLLGGGAFGNRQAWILAAVMRALDTFSRSGLNVHFVSYGQSSGLVRKIIADFEAA